MTLISVHEPQAPGLVSFSSAQTRVETDAILRMNETCDRKHMFHSRHTEGTGRVIRNFRRSGPLSVLHNIPSTPIACSMSAQKQPLATSDNKELTETMPSQSGPAQAATAAAAAAPSVILKKIIDFEYSPSKQELLDLILPPQERPYSWPDLENKLAQLGDELETIQRDANDEFDRKLPDDTQLRLSHLTANLQETQQQVLRMQCKIVQTRDQHLEVKRLCNEKVVQTKREILEAERRLEQSLQKSKFKEVLEFFTLYIIHLDAAVSSTRLTVSRLASTNPLQAFDWNTYHQSMYLLRACGKALIDVDRFERLYQLYTNFSSLTFKKPLSQLDMNNFVDLPAMYSMETQLVVEISPKSGQGSQGEKEPSEGSKSYGQFRGDPKIDAALHSVDQVHPQLFSHTLDRLNDITRNCCRLIIELNSTYIEAHFTDGINIDKLNGEVTHASATLGPAKPASESIPRDPNEPLPSYAFSPQEYITQIGQHVLTLRKQTEPFDQMDNGPLKLALDYLRYDHDNFDTRVFSSVTEIILNCIARLCIRSLIGRTTKSVLSQLTPNGKRQLGTDAMYLDNVLEDLNLLDPTDKSVEKFKLLLEYQ